MNYLLLLPLIYFATKIHVASTCSTELPVGVQIELNSNQMPLLTCYCNTLFLVSSSNNSQDSNTEAQSFGNCMKNLVPINYFKLLTGTKESVSNYVTEAVVVYKLSPARAKSLAESLGVQGFNLNSIIKICSYMPDNCQSQIQMPMNSDDWETVQGAYIDFHLCLTEFSSLQNFQTIAFNIYYWSVENPRSKCDCRDGFVFQGIHYKVSEATGHGTVGTFSDFLTSLCGETTPHWWTVEQLYNILASVRTPQLTTVTTFLNFGYPIAEYWIDEVIKQWPFQDALVLALELKTEFGTLENSFTFLGSIMEKKVTYQQIKNIFHITNMNCKGNDGSNLKRLGIDLINVFLKAKQNRINM